jgi:ATP synthase protein I
MPSNDARILLQAVVPTAIAGALAAVISGVVAGGKGALGAVIGTVVVIAFMGLGQVVLQRTAKSLPQLFQAMGLMLYVAQLLLLLIFVAVFKDTTLFNPKAFAASLVAATVVWMAAQARAHMKAKIFYIDPDSGKDSEKSDKPENSGSSS